MEQNKKQWLVQVANIINVLRTKYPYSEEFCMEISSDDKYYLDSCNFVGLHVELKELESTLRNMVRYFEMSEGVVKYDEEI